MRTKTRTEKWEECTLGNYAQPYVLRGIFLGEIVLGGIVLGGNLHAL